MNLLTAFRFEYTHFVRNTFKMVSLFLFVGAAIYGLFNGYSLYNKQISQIQNIQTANQTSIKKVLEWYDKGQKGPEGKDWVDVTNGFWASWFTPTYSIKTPSDLMPFSVGQAEQYGYYKRVTNWSTVYDNDLAAEIANPERIALGTLDFGFVFLYLMPVLLIILVFNVGGLENEIGLLPLIELQSDSFRKWLLYRFAFYFAMVFAVLLLLILPFAITTGAVYNPTFAKYVLMILAYLLFWFLIFFLINLNKKTAVSSAIQMIGIWVLLCLAIPGAVHQIGSIRHPTNYMTDFIDANRIETQKLWDLENKENLAKLFVLYPQLKRTKFGKDTVYDSDLLGNSSSAIVNELMRKTAEMVETNNQAKNEFIQSCYWFSPINMFDNTLNGLSQTDYYAYKKYRNNIQHLIDIKINILLNDCWNDVKVDKNKYLQNIELLNETRKE